MMMATCIRDEFLASHVRVFSISLPVQTVEIEDLGDPNQGRHIIQGIIDKTKEPKVDLDLRLSVTRYFMA